MPLRHRRIRFATTALALAALTLATPAAIRQSGDELSRGWIIQRPAHRTPTKPRQHRAVTAAPPREASRHEAPPAGPLGLGYSIYRLEADGSVAGVGPSTVFHEGDKVRIVVEPNADGYLYVFDAENDRNPVMIFPDARLYDGDNSVQAHEAIEVPSSQHPKFKWFKFVGSPAVDRLYVVVSREPLPGVPTGAELVKYCDAYASACPWKPADAQWSTIQKIGNAPTSLTTTASRGLAITTANEGVLDRSLVLSGDDPPPAVIGLAGDAKLGAMALKVDLRHE
jgi:uncharacterized protein DUF4384